MKKTVFPLAVRLVAGKDSVFQVEPKKRFKFQNSLRFFSDERIDIKLNCDSVGVRTSMDIDFERIMHLKT